MKDQINATASKIIRKRDRTPKINFIVPPLERMNTNAKCRRGLQSGSVVRSVAIECKHGSTFDSIFQEITWRVTT